MNIAATRFSKISHPCQRPERLVYRSRGAAGCDTCRGRERPVRFRRRSAQAHQVRVHVVQQAALLVAAHHALDPEEVARRGAACHRLDPVHAGAGIEHHVAGRQLDALRAVGVLDDQLAAVVCSSGSARNSVQLMSVRTRSPARRGCSARRCRRGCRTRWRRRAIAVEQRREDRFGSAAEKNIAWPVQRRRARSAAARRRRHRPAAAARCSCACADCTPAVTRPSPTSRRPRIVRASAQLVGVQDLPDVQQHGAFRYRRQNAQRVTITERERRRLGCSGRCRANRRSSLLVTLVTLSLNATCSLNAYSASRSPVTKLGATMPGGLRFGVCELRAIQAAADPQLRRATDRWSRSCRCGAASATGAGRPARRSACQPRRRLRRSSALGIQAYDARHLPGRRDAPGDVELEAGRVALARQHGSPRAAWPVGRVAVALVVLGRVEQRDAGPKPGRRTGRACAPISMLRLFSGGVFEPGAS